MATTTIYRKADVSTADARKSLQRAFPGAKIASLEVVAASSDAAGAARVAVGDLVYEAVVHVGDFPPSAEGDGSSDSGDDAPAPKKEEGDDSDKSESSDSDTDAGGDTDGGEKPNPFGDKEKGGEEGKGDVEHQILHVLTELLHAVKGGSPLGADADAGLGGPDLGGPVPPPPGAGAAPDLDVGAPPAGGPPLPPPVKEKSPLGGSAFSKNYEGIGADENAAEIVFVRHQASEGNKALIAEAAELFGNHKVARIQRTGKAKINGLTVDLPENKVAVVTLTKK